MRISSNTIFDSNVAALNQQQARLLQTQQQVSSGRRMLTASDDPVAAARALDITQSDMMNTQFSANRTAARHTLSLADSTLQSVTALLQDIRTAVVGAGSGTLNNSDRQTIATSLGWRLQELIGLANSTDGVGNYLFSGFQSKTQPFVDTAAGVAYNGDDGQHQVQVSASRQIAATDSGADVFMRVKTGNGTFSTQSAATNTGSGIISRGNVSNPAALTGNNYNVAFSVVAGVTTFSVTNTTTGLPVAGMTGQPYTSGQAISFDGMQFSIQGNPANLDSFTIAPSSNQSIFKTISNMIAALSTPFSSANPAATAASATQLANSMGEGLANLDNGLNKVLTVNSSVGLRLQELDALQTAGDSLGLQFKQTLSQLQDLDYNKALSDLTQQQFTLQAAQKSFAKVSDLSLFSYI